MTDLDVYNMLLDLDSNNDGTISLEEFQKWWLSGRQGITGAMSRLMEQAARKAQQVKEGMPNFASIVKNIPEI